MERFLVKILYTKILIIVIIWTKVWPSQPSSTKNLSIQQRYGRPTVIPLQNIPNLMIFEMYLENVEI